MLCDNNPITIETIFTRSCKIENGNSDWTKSSGYSF